MAGAFIEIKTDDLAVRRAFDRLAAAGRNPQPVLRDIGEYLLTSVEERFDGEHGPDGAKWTPLADATLYRWMGGASSLTKRGNTKVSAIRRLAGKKILTGETHNLRKIIYQVVGTGLSVGTDQKYGAIHQFGGKAGRGLASTIPARPYLGFSDRDNAMIESIVSRYLQRAIP